MNYKIQTSQLLRVFLFLLAVFLLLFARSFFSGEIKKESPQSIAQSIKDFCVENAQKTKGKENCYSEEFQKFAESNGSELSFNVLTELQKNDPDAIGCHLIAHGIGWGSYKKDPENWRELAQNMPTICNYGAIHGVMESYVLSLPEKSLSREVIPTICGENPRADCNHIIGHLLLVQTDAMVDPALDLCTVFDKDAQRKYCISGVFMELQTALNLFDHDLAPESWLNWPARLPELEKICRSYEGEKAEGCWEEIVHVGLAAFNNDPQKIFDFCSTAQVPNGAKMCKRHSIGIIGASRNFDLANLKYMCALPQKDNDPTFQKECYPNIIASALSTIPTKVPEAVQFCNNIQTEFQEGCFSMIGGVGFSIPTVKELLPASCNMARVEYRDHCLGGVRNYAQEQTIRSND